MKVIKTEIEEVLLIEPDVFHDNRGWFSETYNQKKMNEYGITANFIQDNHSLSIHKGTLRGIHFQNEPKAQAKLVRCTRGKILDLAIDLRKNSPTFKKYIIVELSEDNKKQLYIPRGFGHAFLTLTDNTEVNYKVDEFYSKEHDRSIYCFDSDLNIEWGISDVILSDKDLNAPLLNNCDFNFEYKKENKE